MESEQYTLMYTCTDLNGNVSAPPSCWSPDGTSVPLVYYRAQDTSVFTLMVFVGLFEHFIYRIRVRTPRKCHECDVLSCLLPRSVRLACHRVFLPDSSCHCHGFAILSPSGSFGTRHLILLDPLQHLFLLKSLCSSLKVTMQTPSASFTPAVCTCPIYAPAS